MIPTLAGALSSAVFVPVTVAVVGPTNNQSIPIPPGASTYSVYMVMAGGAAFGGVATKIAGDGGNCYWAVDVAVAGSTSLLIDFSGGAVYPQPNNDGISLPFLNRGGAGGASGLDTYGTGGAAATEIAPGAAGRTSSGVSPAGPVSVTAGSVLAGYVGHGGDNSSNYKGVGWGGGGGFSTVTQTYAVGGPAGALLIFK